MDIYDFCSVSQVILQFWEIGCSLLIRTSMKPRYLGIVDRRHNCSNPVVSSVPILNAEEGQMVDDFLRIK